MGGQPVGSRIFDYMREKPDLRVRVTQDEILSNVDGLNAKQVRAAMRRLADQEMVDIITPGSMWRLSRGAQIMLRGEPLPAEVADTSPARLAREDGAAARQAIRERTFEHVDNFEGGAILLRSEAGKFFRAELTEL